MVSTLNKFLPPSLSPQKKPCSCPYSGIEVKLSQVWLPRTDTEDITAVTLRSGARRGNHDLEDDALPPHCRIIFVDMKETAVKQGCVLCCFIQTILIDFVLKIVQG